MDMANILESINKESASKSRMCTDTQQLTIDSQGNRLEQWIAKARESDNRDQQTINHKDVSTTTFSA
jgi:hypothetical protein